MMNAERIKAMGMLMRNSILCFHIAFFILIRSICFSSRKLLVFAGILSELHIMFSVVMLVYYVNCISPMRIHAKTKLQLKI